MQETVAEIVRLLESADELFKEIDTGSEEARALWKAGIDRLAAAIWICERGEEDKSTGE